MTPSCGNDLHLDEVKRAQLAGMCRNKNLRNAQFTRDNPKDWQPRNVLDPETGVGFTEPKAWNYIADLLEAGHPVQVIVLDKPPGKLGYVMTTIMPNGSILYIKLQLSNKALGRSFHYSYIER